MPASLQKISDNCKINPNNEHPIPLTVRNNTCSFGMTKNGTL
jgi:hypothetical protein